MARQMVQSGELTGFNSEQLQAKLGIPDDTLVVDTDHNRLRYYFGVLEVSMEKGKVVQARLSTRGW